MSEYPAVTPEFLAAARGDAPADVLFRGGCVVNVFSREIVKADVAVFGGRICSVGPGILARRTVELGGRVIAPGFIDAHMHVESTMLPPSEFVRLAAPHGTTGVVLDPHEIANVHGVAGIEAVMRNAGEVGEQPIDFMFTLSSCVPSCHLETSGAELTAADLEPMFDDERVVALAEMMNYPGVVFGDPGVLEKVNLGLRRRIVDGHCPGLRGAQLQAYVAAGISSDHESVTLDEAKEKLALGMTIYIREGSAAKNLEALRPIVNERTASRICWCTDDRHPADLQHEGHIDHIVRKAVGLGLDPVTAITIATLNPATHYGRRDVGAVAPGRWANLVVFDSIDNLSPCQVYFKGELIAEDGNYLPQRAHTPESIRSCFPEPSVILPENLDIGSFHVSAPAVGARIRVIDMDPTQLVTGELRIEPLIESDSIVSDMARDVLKLAVIERHSGTGNIGLGFVRGFQLQRGAIASTVGHDAHNLAVVGTNDTDMLIAAKALAQARGGQCAAVDGAVVALLPLPIAGLMSDQPAERVIEQQAALLDATKTLGCPHHDPFMPLSFLPLPVIPKLKLSDKGLVDVERFDFVPLVCDRVEEV